jgi:UDP-GlcNAc:undecaprenyl-phosphate GlcNAc-1-phosphate transferase
MVIIIGSSFILSLVLVVVVLRLSHIKSWYDIIDDRKIHTGDVPRLGGVGFSLAFIVVAFVISFTAPETHYGLGFVPVIMGMFLTLFFGVFDDFRPLRPQNKLLVQIIAGLLVVIPDFTFHRLFFFDIGPIGDLGWFRYPLTLFWIVGMINALNLIDGVDGLAGGIGTLLAFSYALIFSSFANSGSAILLCLCLSTAICGFLVFNLPLPKARIFMGDGGSQFLGLIVAVLPLVDRGNTEANFPLAYAAALLLIPILDTTAAVWRRVREGRRIGSPDKAHIHHKLMNLGLNAWSVNVVLYLLQITLGVLVFFAFKAPGIRSVVLLCIAYVVGIAFFSVIHFLNKAFLKHTNDVPAAGDMPQNVNL